MAHCVLLLTYLNSHNNPISGFRSAATPPSRRLFLLRVYASWSLQRIQGRPLRRLPWIPASNTRLTGVSSSVQTTWPSQRRHWILIRCTTSMSLSSSYSSLLYRMQKSILPRTFLSNTLKAATSVLNRVHVSGKMSDL